MRRILINSARRKRQIKHGGDLSRLELDEAIVVGDTQSENLVALDAALTKLSEKDNVKAELVKLRYFAGLTTEQSANALGISYASAKRSWAYAERSSTPTSRGSSTGTLNPPTSW